MSEISGLAEEIITTEFDYLTGADRSSQHTRTENWLLYNQGLLNSRIYTQYSGENPEFNLEESNIYKNMYMSNYYRSEAQKVLRNMSSDTLEWLSIKEADSSIKLQNKNEVARTFTSMSNSLKAELESQIFAYNSYIGSPKDVEACQYSAEPYN